MTAGPSQSTGQSFRVGYQHGMLVVRLESKLQPGDLPGLKTIVEDSVGRGWKLVLIEMAALRFIDTGLAGFFVEITRHAKSHGGALALLKPQHTVVLFLRSNNYLKDLEVYEDRAEAVRSLTGQHLRASSKDPGERAAEEETHRLLEVNGYVLATLAQSLHSKGVFTGEDLQMLFEFSETDAGGRQE